MREIFSHQLLLLGANNDSVWNARFHGGVCVRIIEELTQQSDNAFEGCLRGDIPPKLLLTVLTSRCDFAEGSPPGLMVCTTQERLKIGTLYT